MARSKEQSGKQRERLVPNIAQASSRVSNVVGGESLHSQGRGPIYRAHEQRTSASSTKAKARAATRGSTGRNGSAKKNPGPTRAAPSPTPPAGGPADSRFIARGLNGWNNLEPHHQQRILSVVLLALALLLFASLTIFRHAALLSAISGAFTMLFGWLVYPLAIGLVAFAVAHLVEGMRKQRLIRWPLVIGLIVLSLILMAESDLIAPKAEVGGVIGAILAFPLLGWGFFGHLILIVLFIVIAMVTFRVTLSHVTAFGRAVGGVVVSNRGAAGNGPRPSPFLGQRPVHSRFAQPRSAASEDDDDVGDIDFEADFGDAEDDPENDINLHKGKVSSIPRRQRNAPPLDADEHQDAVQGAVQPELPINQRERRQKKYPTMQELPMRANAPAAAPPASALPSNWPLPELTMLNNPEEVKAHLLGDDTPGLAKLIQETLRSFRVEAEVREADISIGPTVIRFGIRPTGKPTMVQDEKGRYVPAKDPNGNILYEQRTRVNRIMALQNDLALVLEAKTIRMEAPVPGRPYVGVEIPNKNSRLVTLREVLESKEYQSAKAKSKLAIALGRDVAGAVRVGDLTRMPHLLIAGATGAGKCLAYDEPVFLADGSVVKVQSLIGQTTQVIGITNTETMQQIPVFATFTENGVQEVFEIEFDNGVTLRRTGEHPLWAARLNENQHVGRQADGKASRRTRAINAGWVQAKDLRVCGNRPYSDGHVILCPIELYQRGTVLKSDADVILCSALLAEGGLNKTGRSNLLGRSLGTPRITNADSLMIEQVTAAAKEYGCQLVLSPSKVKGDIDYYISQISRRGGNSPNPIAQLVCDWKINCLATQKRIPEWVFQLPDEQIALFLRVFIDCDGWMSVRGHRSSVSTSLAPLQKFSDCPVGYEWRKIVSIRCITAPTVNIEVHSENHAFVGYAVEHNSVCQNTIIASILTQATPDDVRLLMVDPKMVELNMYTGIPHLLVPVVTEVEKVVPLLKNAINEMERRYRLFSRLGVRNLDGYRKLRAEKLTYGDASLENLPAIVIIIDELADLMMAAPEEVEGMICRLAQLARATGIHLVIATQRPSVDVITGLIKANIPTRISFMVSSAVDSRTIIDMGGAERLLGRGDMLYLPADAGRPERIQGAFLADDEAERLVEFWKQQGAINRVPTQGQSQGIIAAASAAPEQFVEPGWEIRQSDSDDFELDDDLLEKAEEIVREYGRASISLLQRRLRIGYSRAARLIDLLEEQGIIGPFEPGGRAREILSDGNGSLGGGRTMADEVADIIAEEKAREEFLKKQRQDSPDAP
ncbi:MAG: DNA translocase FtsK [Ktedonobacteraceae bacterium]